MDMLPPGKRAAYPQWNGDGLQITHARVRVPDVAEQYELPTVPRKAAGLKLTVAGADVLSAVDQRHHRRLPSAEAVRWRRRLRAAPSNRFG